MSSDAERSSPLMILVAGPYRSGTNDDPALIAGNVRAMTDMALRLFRAGHLPAGKYQIVRTFGPGAASFDPSREQT